MKDWVHVVSGQQPAADTARALLALADSPSHVRTIGTGTEFMVPPYLAERYNRPPAPKRGRTKREEGDE